MFEVIFLIEFFFIFKVAFKLSSKLRCLLGAQNNLNDCRICLLANFSTSESAEFHYFGCVRLGYTPIWSDL